MGKKEKTLDASEVFQMLQDWSDKGGGAKTSFAIERPDGWKWEFVVTAPGKAEEETENEE